MNRPLTRAGGTQAVVGQVGAFTDAHAGVTEQEEDISAQIVAAQELLLEELILLGGERPWQSVGRARDILAQQQVSELGEMAGAGQFSFFPSPLPGGRRLLLLPQDSHRCHRRRPPSWLHCRCQRYC